MLRSQGTGFVIMDNKEPAGRTPPCFGIGKFLLAVVLAVLFLLLAQSMVQHRFFRGGSQERHGSISP
ncbi:MAG: hypothetical protein WBD25_17400 [Terriglobales bacterium]